MLEEVLKARRLGLGKVGQMWGHAQSMLHGKFGPSSINFWLEPMNKHTPRVDFCQLYEWITVITYSDGEGSQTGAVGAALWRHDLHRFVAARMETLWMLVACIMEVSRRHHKDRINSIMCAGCISWTTWLRNMRFVKVPGLADLVM